MRRCLSWCNHLTVFVLCFGVVALLCSVSPLHSIQVDESSLAADDLSHSDPNDAFPPFFTHYDYPSNVPDYDGEQTTPVFIAIRPLAQSKAPSFIFSSRSTSARAPPVFAWSPFITITPKDNVTCRSCFTVGSIVILGTSGA